MPIDSKIWYDLVNTKFGDEYLVLYLRRQRNIRKYFKISTILFSAGGIFSASIMAQIPTIISLVAIALVQSATSIENFIIHSEDDLDKLSKLRLLYFERTNKLEELWYALNAQKITNDEAANEFFSLRKSAREIEELDNKINVRKFDNLMSIADKNTRNYLNIYYDE